MSNKCKKFDSIKLIKYCTYFQILDYFEDNDNFKKLKKCKNIQDFKELLDEAMNYLNDVSAKNDEVINNSSMKVRVTKLPKNCNECIFVDHFLNSKCKLVRMSEKYDSNLCKNKRRYDCPLIDDKNVIGSLK